METARQPVLPPRRFALLVSPDERSSLSMRVKNITEANKGNEDRQLE
jgi:hypothetical protein